MKLLLLRQDFLGNGTADVRQAEGETGDVESVTVGGLDFLGS